MEPTQPGVRDRDAETRQQLSEEQLLAALNQPIEPVKLSFLYRIGLLLVTVAMALLPLLYLALIVLLGWGVYLHAIHDYGLITNAPRGRAAIFAFAAYAGPIIAGLVAILFMFKPVLAPPPKAPDNIKLDPRQQPLLHRFVRRLCEAVGAPVPQHIEVDIEVNASARLRRGILSFFSNDLVLTIGLPLVAGLSLRQLAGVLAHELGHFAQSGGMRLSYVVRSINAWFARVVYDRDAWDDKLDQWTREADHLAIKSIFMLTKGVVWLSRKVLWLLMVVGHAISCFMLRQMEYDADRYEVRIAGSKTFEETAKRLAVLAVGSQAAYATLGRAWTEKRLGDDLTALIHSRVAGMPSEVVSSVHESLLERKTGLFDTHPADRDRIANARSMAVPGVVHFDQPATLLLGDFSKLSQHATLSYYRDVLGPTVDHNNLVATSELVAEQQRLEEAHEAFGGFFQHGQLALRALSINNDTMPPEDPTQLLADLKSARQRMEDGAEAARATVRRYDQIEDHLLSMAGVEALVDAGVKVSNPGALNAPTADPLELGHLRLEAREEMGKIMAARAAFERDAGLRLTATLRFLHAPLLGTRLGDTAAMSSQASALIAALAALGAHHDRDTELRIAFSRSAILLNNIEAHREKEQYIKQVLDEVSRVRELLGEVHQALAATPYPFAHAGGQVSIADFLIEELPDADDVGGVMNVAHELLEATTSLYFRVLATLTAIAAQVEKALGLPPYPEPPEEPEED
jgi:Zn-dependent protease with chaperone function